MAVNWKDLLAKAIEYGQDEAVTFLNENREFIEGLPRVAFTMFESVLPGKRTMTNDRAWVLILREMPRAERDRYNQLMIQDAQAAAQMVLGVLKTSKLFQNAASALSDLGRAVVSFMLRAFVEELSKKATPPPA